MEIINKVTESGLITINPEHYLAANLIKEFDLKSFLFMEMILKEKDYREALKNFDWSVYQDCIVAVHCSNDAIIPVWAYMLCTTYLSAVAKDVRNGSLDLIKENVLLENINADDYSIYTDKMIVVKGCGEESVPPSAYLTITQKLMPFAKSIMYGEPCSTVPIYKRKKVIA
jgi:Protein of unknown function (DUF2480)